MLEKTLKAITGDDVRIFPMHSPDHRRAFLGSSAHVASVLDLEQIRVGPREVRAIELKSKPKKPMARSISTVASAGASLPISKSVDASTRTMVTSHAMMSAVGRIRRHLLALGHVADALAEAWGEDLPSDITDKRWRRGRWRHPGRESSSGAGASSTPDEEFYRDTLPEKDEPLGLSGAKTGEVAVAHSKALQAEVALPEAALPGIAAGQFYSPTPLMQSPAAEVLATSTPTPSSKAADDALVRLPVGVFVRCKRTSACPTFGGVRVCPGKFLRIVYLHTNVWGGITELECIVHSVESNGKPRYDSVSMSHTERLSGEDLAAAEEE